MNLKDAIIRLGRYLYDLGNFEYYRQKWLNKYSQIKQNI